jgi:hypothetical protein
MTVASEMLLPIWQIAPENCQNGRHSKIRAKVLQSKGYAELEKYFCDFFICFSSIVE